MGFLQLTPENIAQARSLSYPEAFKLDQTYKFDPNFKGGVSRSKYIGEGLKSLIGLGDPNIGGATPLTRKIALDAADLAKSFGGKALNFLGKASIPLSVLSSTPLGANDMVTQEMRDSIDTTGINSLRGDPAQFYGEDPFLSETRDYTDGELYDIDDTGRIPTITDRLKGGIGSIRDTVTDKLGSVGDFIKGGGILGNIFSGFGKRGDESTRGIAGLNVNDVFNIDSFGSDEDPTKDPYGINIVSAKGNYNEYVKNKARELAKMQFKTKSGKQRQDFYKQAAEEIRAKELAALQAAARAAGFTGGPGGDSSRSDEQQSFSDTQSYGGGGTRDDMGADTFT
tara:strand:- start:41 stop:1060 length:1020 start_codon:yes stop_codon:yes gene_type:complete